jgi:hypothetical protein
MNVPGRNNMVRTAMLFITSLSRLVDMAMELDCSDMEMLVRESFWVIKLATYRINLCQWI